MTYEVAAVVGFASIVTEEAHGVVLGNMFRVVLDELLGAVPERGDCLLVLVQAKDKAVLLVAFLHDTERVIVDVAVKLDGGLDAPVVLVVHEQRLTEEESRLESAHVAVTDGVAVDDLALSHIFTDLACLFLVDPLGERPVLGSNLSIERVAGHEGSGDLLEGGVKGLVVKEDPVVVVAAIEAILDLTNRLGNLPDVAVTGEGDEGGIDARTWRGAEEIIPASIIGRHGHRELLRVVIVHDGRALDRRQRRLRRGLLVLSQIRSRPPVEGAIVERRALVARMCDEIEDGEALKKAVRR